jgi:SAM-dependent methyltransferase
LLEPHILEQAQGGDLDEASREKALDLLRHANFRRLFSWLADFAPPGGIRPRLLEVGCAHGWFMDTVSSRFDVSGIEPDIAVATATRARGLAVMGGFFPDVLGSDDHFDIIVFNDVLEHIPDANAALAACWRHRVPGGRIVVNAPSRRGFLYRVSKVLASLGLPGSFERMWQLGFPSPHVHYFDSESICRLAGKAGFVLESRKHLASVAVRGLYARVRYARDVTATKAALLTLAVALMSPLLAVLPPDIEVWILRRQE